MYSEQYELHHSVLVNKKYLLSKSSSQIALLPGSQGFTGPLYHLIAHCTMLTVALIRILVYLDFTALPKKFCWISKL